jgi:PHP family Zn ribbon phosphoesterase
MKIRPHRELLLDSMDEVEEISPTIRAISLYLTKKYREKVSENSISIRHYCYDDRIQWDTFIVTMNGCAVAFTNSNTEG